MIGGEVPAGCQVTGIHMERFLEVGVRLIESVLHPEDGSERAEIQAISRFHLERPTQLRFSLGEISASH